MSLQSPRIRKQIATKFVQTRLHVGAVALEVNLRYLPIRTFSLRAFRDAASLPARRAPCGVEHGGFWHHHHFGFHLFNLRGHGRHDNVLLAQEISFKARMAALVVASRWKAPPIMQTPGPAPSGMGCFAKGCLSLIIAGLVLVAVFVGRHLLRVLKPRPQRLPPQPSRSRSSVAARQTPAERQVAKAKLRYAS